MSNAAPFKKVTDNRKRHVERIAYPDYEGAYILLSFGVKPSDFAETWLEPTISFLYDAGEQCCEWEPSYGPLQLWKKCGADHPNRMKNYFYEWVESKPGNYSQSAVEETGIKIHLAAGNYPAVFDVLKHWAERGD